MQSCNREPALSRKQENLLYRSLLKKKIKIYPNDTSTSILINMDGVIDRMRRSVH